MAKTNKIDEQLELDNQEILRLIRIVSPTPSDMASIYNMYVKYIDKNARYFNSSGCSTCGNSIVKYWRELAQWYELNKSNVFGV